MRGMLSMADHFMNGGNAKLVRRSAQGAPGMPEMGPGGGAGRQGGGEGSFGTGEYYFNSSAMTLILTCVVKATTMTFP